MSLTVAITAKPCHYCGSYHSTICPRVEEIEYHQDGSVKRVRLRGPDTPADAIDNADVEYAQQTIRPKNTPADSQPEEPT